MGKQVDSVVTADSLCEGKSSAVHMVHLSKRRRWGSLAVLALGMLVLSFDMTIMDVALPSIAKELHPASDQQLWMIDVYSLTLAGLLVSASSLSDRIGRKKMFTLGALVFCVASALVLVADTSNKVIAVRAFMGVAAAMIMPITMSMIRNIFTDARERAVAISVWAVVTSVGNAVGPILGGALLAVASWHATFLINIPLMGVALVAGLILLPEITVEKKGPWDLLAAALSLGGMALAVWAIKRMAATLHVGDPVVTVALIVGLVLLALFVRRCWRAPEPLLNVRLFVNGAFTGGIVTAFGATFASAALFFLLSQWLQLVGDYTPLGAGLRMLPIAIAATVSGAVAPSLAIKVGARTVITACILIATIAMGIIVIAGVDITYTEVALAMVFTGLCMGGFAVGSSVIMTATPPESSASGAAFEEIAYDVGHVLGVAFLGSAASMVYRNGFSVDSFIELGLSSSQIADAMDSFGAAVSIAQETGITELITQGSLAFNESLMLASLVGAILLALLAVVVFRLIPKDFDIAEEE